MEICILMCFYNVWGLVVCLLRLQVEDMPVTLFLGILGNRKRELGFGKMGSWNETRGKDIKCGFAARYMWCGGNGLLEDFMCPRYAYRSFWGTGILKTRNWDLRNEICGMAPKIWKRKLKWMVEELSASLVALPLWPYRFNTEPQPLFPRNYASMFCSFSYSYFCFTNTCRVVCVVYVVMRRHKMVLGYLQIRMQTQFCGNGYVVS